jgi:HPt (histidine-containing phosphotransfer) domain-containing protein
MIKMLNTFVENSENTLENFRRLLKHENWKQIGEAAHKILPSYRHLEVHGITSDLTEIKTKTLIESDNKTVPVLVEKVIKEMGEIVLELKEEIKQLI